MRRSGRSPAGAARRRTGAERKPAGGSPPLYGTIRWTLCRKGVFHLPLFAFLYRGPRIGNPSLTRQWRQPPAIRTPKPLKDLGCPDRPNRHQNASRQRQAVSTVLSSGVRAPVPASVPARTRNARQDRVAGPACPVASPGLTLHRHQPWRSGGSYNLLREGAGICWGGLT